MDKNDFFPHFMIDNEVGIPGAIMESFGYEGYGMFWVIIEAIRQGENIQLDDDSEINYSVTMSQLLEKTGLEEHCPIFEFLQDAEAIQISNEIVSSTFLEKRMVRQIKRKRAGLKAAKTRWNKLEPENNTEPTKEVIDLDMSLDNPPAPEVELDTNLGLDLDMDLGLDLDMDLDLGMGLEENNQEEPVMRVERESDADEEKTSNGKLSLKSKKWFTDPKLWVETKQFFSEKHPHMPDEYLEAQKEKFLNHFDGKRLPSYRARFANWLTSRYADPVQQVAIEKSQIFVRFMDKYLDFMEKWSIKPKITWQEEFMLQGIITHFDERCGDMDENSKERVMFDNWCGLLDNWGLLDDFMKTQVTIRQINHNLTQLAAQIKLRYGRNKTGSQADNGATESAFQQKARNRSSEN